MTLSSGISRTKTIVLILVILVSLFVRLEYVIQVNTQPISDMQDYDRRAVTLQEKGTFATNEKHGATYRPPGYVVFLALIYKVFGHNYHVVYILQSLMSVSVLLAIYLFARRVFDQNTALMGLIIAALYVPFIGYSGVLLTEILFLTLFSYALYSFVRGTQENKVHWFVLSGVLFGLATLTRSISLLVPLILLGWYCLRSYKEVLTKRLWFPSILMILFMALTIMPWTIRNYMEQKEFVLVDTISGLNLLTGNNDYATGYYTDEVMKLPGYRRAVTEGKNDAQVDRFMKQEAVRWIAQHPVLFIKLVIRKLLISVSDTRDWIADLYHFDKIFLYSKNFNKYYHWTLMALGAVGAVMVLLYKREALFVVLTATYFPAVLSIFFFQYRYIFPAIILIIPLAAFAVQQIYSRKSYFAFICAAVLVFVLKYTAYYLIV
ncbi:hypothetical protein Tfer_2713 [Thermincola ferriacetica]|uniref:Glycosyltransferase RgtA/B/C/D-like domain-containing protein n=1 Tax=Thermincola ferriacetica TaxID=281456 RepID=A0A0L6VZZ2_9FIRM|nr:glycosyltransferase family 39 protein [Thermincola ferriacetica]KNZ68718.1 hypothetical protein Tfer_2713 [Thermincola ferriacetica]